MERRRAVTDQRTERGCLEGLKIVGHMLQVDDGVDVLDVHIVRHAESDGRIVEQCPNASLNANVGHLLG